jgi:hypothetical protein
MSIYACCQNVWNPMVIFLLDTFQGSFGQSFAATPWLSPEVFGPALGALVGAVVTFLITRGTVITTLVQQNTLLQEKADELRTNYKKIKAELEAKAGKTKGELEAAEAEIVKLRNVADRYYSVRKKLEKSFVIDDYVQPVLLLGRRSVGKTSLMKQWHTPWDSRRLDPSTTYKQNSVPVYDHPLRDTKTHFADDSIKTPVRAHLKLQVHDFPGDRSAQLKIAEIARLETEHLQQETGKNLGVVLICMFDAEEAYTGIKEETRNYYNDLFNNLRTAVPLQIVRIQRVIVVFNKFDLLRKKLPDKPAEHLLKLCIETHYEILREFWRICNAERVCETITVLDRDNLVMSQGALTVLGEAARGLFEAVAGPAETEQWLGNNRATGYLAAKYRPAST